MPLDEEGRRRARRTARIALIICGALLVGVAPLVKAAGQETAAALAPVCSTDPIMNSPLPFPDGCTYPAQPSSSTKTPSTSTSTQTTTTTTTTATTTAATTTA